MACTNEDKACFCFYLDSGIQRPKGKTSEPEHHGRKGENDGVVKIPAEKSTAKKKKSAKLSSCVNTGQEEPLSNVKKPAKIKSAIESTGLSSAKPKKQVEDRNALKNKKRAQEQEHVAEEQDHSEPPPNPAEQPEVQSMSTGTEMMIKFV